MGHHAMMSLYAHIYDSDGSRPSDIGEFDLFINASSIKEADKYLADYLVETYDMEDVDTFLQQHVSWWMLMPPKTRGVAAFYTGSLPKDTLFHISDELLTDPLALVALAIQHNAWYPDTIGPTES